MSLRKKKSSPLGRIEPNFNKKRYRCPFYGFSRLFGGLFPDQGGNQCPLCTDSFSPCRMERINQIPDWENCPFNSEKNKEGIKAVIASCRIAPQEFKPKRLSFKDWMGYVMSESVERPDINNRS